jgi:hypothetical protein
MNVFIKALFGGLVAALAHRCRNTVADWVKIQVTILYLKGVQIARDICRSLVAVVLCLLLALTGVVLLHVGIFILLPPPLNGIVLVVLGFAYIGGGLYGVHRFTSDARWLKIAQADRCVKAATQTRPS